MCGSVWGLKWSPSERERASDFRLFLPESSRFVLFPQLGARKNRFSISILVCSLLRYLSHLINIKPQNLSYCSNFTVSLLPNSVRLNNSRLIVVSSSSPRFRRERWWLPPFTSSLIDGFGVSFVRLFMGWWKTNISLIYSQPISPP